ncbi:type II toxin-antitoxin system RatA family toxin [Pseudidiomarina andamanensis]|uniref:Type II toxin-antitoxin system RatA family toxin n=1 Tax=Pseudidiomarina andamanensis TaxID=1940690 RepID=A0AA92ES89_9GAMM|nr:type II toxin-antitoxin system RatA family toxin [Pseudidiomarina andamanensis]MDS0218126.1 type II toxin-antitoxin system RatA family toxin [Pseudidiomarina andamanensis]QGT95013.1 type II toxin-antitoxin system RatA family toxin [Pseudidiomarina andamanensis]
MPTIERSALVPYSDAQMYALVNDIDRYPEFVPGCRSASVLESDEQNKVARLDISKAGISKSFTTRNTLVPFERIDMELVDGPFQYLRGGWSFHKLDEQACKIVLKLEFEFANRLLGMAFGKIFNELQSRMVDAFVQRAQHEYGTK